MIKTETKQTSPLEKLFSRRIQQMQPSFLREILKITAEPGIISFAGGLPNPDYFPIQELKESTESVLRSDGKNVLQYGPSNGYQPLREWIAKYYYSKKGLEVNPEQILITSGSQQGIDLLGKVLLDPGDRVLMEAPGYLGAIQGFSAYSANFDPVIMQNDGPDTAMLSRKLAASPYKFFYTVPTFQNPTGISYSEEKRKIVSNLIAQHHMLLIEDDPYSEIYFQDKPFTPLKHYLGDQSVLLGSFSKMIAPGMRLGWIVAPTWLFKKLLLAKQGADLHANQFTQHVITHYLEHHDTEAHWSTIRKVYNKQCNSMLSALKKFMPNTISWTKPEGGMFIWLQLPQHINSLELFKKSIKKNVAFVPGEVFYTSSKATHYIRLNYSNASPKKIFEGIHTLSKIIKKEDKTRFTKQS
jgi:2-aminoadipate transaminase